MKRTGKKSLNLESHHKKVNLSDQINAQFGRHRSGWSYVVHHLGRLQNPNGIKLDTFVERTFCWHPDGTKPHLVPWIGFFHVPPNIPRWFHFEQTSTSIFASKAWQESVIHCQGLFTLSKYLKRHLAAKVKVPVHQLIFPTETRQDKWTWDKFINNKEKKLIQVGWWLRRLHAIYQFPQTQYKKIFLNVQHPSIPQLISKEREILLKQGTFKDEMYDSAQNINYLDDADYDDLLSKNLVFLSLYDASASNTIIECIVRDTPILINPLEPVKEYLGENYPFYYTSLAEAEQKVNNYDLIYKTHEFLKSHPIKERLNIEYFLKSLIDSEIYQNLNPAYSSE